MKIGANIWVQQYVFENYEEYINDIPYPISKDIALVQTISGFFLRSFSLSSVLSKKLLEILK